MGGWLVKSSFIALFGLSSRMSFSSGPSVAILSIIGGWDDNWTNRDEILMFNGSWTMVGMVKRARSYAAATKIEVGDHLDIESCW